MSSIARPLPVSQLAARPLPLPLPVDQSGASQGGASQPGISVPVPAPHRADPVVPLLESATESLVAATTSRAPTDRYAAAHLAALRAAAAVLAVRAVPGQRQRGARRRRAGSRPASAWSLLAEVAPELGEWAAFFAAGAGKRAAAEAGITRAVSLREADDLLRAAETFLVLVHRLITDARRGDRPAVVDLFTQPQLQGEESRPVPLVTGPGPAARDLRAG